MTLLTSWLGDSTAISATDRAVLAWRRILDKPTTVTLRTAAGVNRTAQTMRVEVDNSASPAEGSAGLTPMRKVIVFGVRSHPTVADTIMAEGDRFVLNGDQLRCIDTILTLGEIQGIFESIG